MLGPVVVPPEGLDLGPVELEVRPRRIRWVAWVLAILLFAFFASGALLVYVGSAGFNFRPADQVAMVVLGADPRRVRAAVHPAAAARRARAGSRSARRC